MNACYHDTARFASLSEDADLADDRVGDQQGLAGIAAGGSPVQEKVRAFVLPRSRHRFILQRQFSTKLTSRLLVRSLRAAAKRQACISDYFVLTTTKPCPELHVPSCLSEMSYA